MMPAADERPTDLPTAAAVPESPPPSPPSATATTTGSAAEAAIRSVTSAQSHGAPLATARRLRFFTLTAINSAVIAFVGCTVFGVLLAEWASEAMIVEPALAQHTLGLTESEPHVVFTERHQTAIRVAHWGFGIVSMIALIAYAVLHWQFRTAFRALPEATRTAATTAPHGGYPAVIVALMAVLIGAGMVTASQLPRKPLPAEMLKRYDTHFVRGTTPPPPKATMFPVPEHVSETNRETEWWIHTVAVPTAFCLLLLALSLAVYSVQRCKLPATATPTASK